MRGGFGVNLSITLGSLKASTVIVTFSPSLNFSDSRNSQYLTIGMI